MTKVTTKDNCTHGTGAAEPRLPLRARSARSTFPLFHSARGARGFTLMELLVVIAVIGILVGIVVPIVGGMARRARDSQARDMCSQIAEAWTILSMDNSRLPSAELVLSVCDGEKSGGDVICVLGPGPAAGELLNGWKSVSPIPDADKARYKPRVDVSKGVIPDYEDAVEFPPDQVFERSVLQKRVGIIAPWAESRIAEDATDLGEARPNIQELESDVLHEMFKNDRSPLYHALVCVALDTDGDGKIKIPSTSKRIDTNGEDIELRATAVAWVWDEKQTKTLRSW